MSVKLKEPIQTHEGCRVCQGHGKEYEFDPDCGKEIIMSDPCDRCGGDGYDRAETEKELDAAASRFAEESRMFYESMKLRECSNVIDN